MLILMLYYESILLLDIYMIFEYCVQKSAIYLGFKLSITYIIDISDEVREFKHRASSCRFVL